MGSMVGSVFLHLDGKGQDHIECMCSFLTIDAFLCIVAYGVFDLDLTLKAKW